MALSFANAPGNCMNRIGKAGAIIKQLGLYQSTQKTLLIDTTTGLMAQFVTEQDIQAVVGQAYISQTNNPDSICSFVASVAEQGLNRSVFRDNPQLAQNLSQLNTLASLQELIRQMKVQNATVLAMTITGTPAAFVGTGNGVVNFSAKRPLDGLVLENTFGETITILCSADSYTGGATAGNESFTATGQGTESDPFAFDWPLGSNCSKTLSAIDGDASNASNNVLNGSNFATWSSGLPSGWTAPVTNGSDITQNNSITYGSGSSVQLTGDGVTLTQLAQQFNSSTGTTGTLSPLTQYGFCIFLRRDGTAAAQGTLTVDLVDGNNNVINDVNGVANTFNFDLTALAPAFAGYIGVIRTPVIMPSTYSIRYRLSTALTNGRSVYLAKSSLGQMSQLYTSGPYIAVHAGSTPFVAGDYSFLPITNSRGAGGTLNTFQTLFARIFPQMIQNELLLPSSATPSLSDSVLIA